MVDYGLPLIFLLLIFFCISYDSIYTHNMFIYFPRHKFLFQEDLAEKTSMCRTEKNMKNRHTRDLNALIYPRFPRSSTPWNLFELLTPKFFSSLRAFSASRRPSCPWLRNMADFANAHGKTTKQGRKNELNTNLDTTNMLQSKNFSSFCKFPLVHGKEGQISSS